MAEEEKDEKKPWKTWKLVVVLGCVTFLLIAILSGEEAVMALGAIVAFFAIIVALIWGTIIAPIIKGCKKVSKWGKS